MTSVEKEDVPQSAQCEESRAREGSIHSGQ